MGDYSPVDDAPNIWPQYPNLWYLNSFLQITVSFGWERESARRTMDYISVAFLQFAAHFEIEICSTHTKRYLFDAAVLLLPYELQIIIIINLRFPMYTYFPTQVSNVIFALFTEGLLKVCDKLSNPCSLEETSFSERVYGTFMFNNCRALRAGHLSYAHMKSKTD